MTLVHDVVDATVAQVHALIIGIGHYTHLGEPDAQAFRLRADLTSAPLSAAAFAGFVLDEQNCQDGFSDPVPLGSVDVHISGQNALSSQRTGQVAIDGSATTPVVVQAIKDWAARCRAHPDNVALFYFCGHGINNARELSLLLSDFGTSPNVLEDAVSLTALQGAMGNQSAPSLQCFFVDACQLSSSQAMAMAHGAGRDVLGHRLDTRGAEDSPIYYATLPNDPAYGADGQVSSYTSSLLRALRGLGSEPRGAGWFEVTTSALGRGVEYAMKAEKLARLTDQRPQAGGWAGRRVIHRLSDPGEIPVSIIVHPGDEVDELEVYQGSAVRARSGPADEYHFELPIGAYIARARFRNPRCVLEDQEISPLPPGADLRWRASWQ